MCILVITFQSNAVVSRYIQDLNVVFAAMIGSIS